VITSFSFVHKFPQDADISKKAGVSHSPTLRALKKKGGSTKNLLAAFGRPARPLSLAARKKKKGFTARREFQEKKKCRYL
jgi:hypothetical protein